MKETGESRSTKNKTVILLLIILLILIWFVGEILISYHWMKVNRYPVTGPESAVYGYGYRCRIQDGGDFRIFMIMNSVKIMSS